MNRRALAFALALAAAGALLLLLYLRKFEREKSGGELVELLIAVKPIARGAVLTNEMLATRAVPIAYVEDRAIKAAERAKVVGLQASSQVRVQQTLLWTDLAITTEERDLSELVQPGKRAFTVRAVGAGDTRGNALISPGDYVDVIVTMGDEREPDTQRSVVLLQRILVLAVGNDTGALDRQVGHRDGPGRSSEKVLTLSLNLQESQLLALALEKGRISVAVRNAEDQRLLADVPDMKSTALLDSAQRDATRRAPTRSLSQPIRIDDSRGR